MHFARNGADTRATRRAKTVPLRAYFSETELPMKSLKSLLALVVLLACATDAARAADLSQAVMLVATERLAGSGYEEAVLVAAPLAQGGHVGFIVNRPTGVKLESVFPDYAPSREVTDPLYLGGPILAEGVFAITHKAPQGDGETIALMPGLVAVLDAASLDRVIKTTPNDARYFAGLMVWRPGELDDEVREGAWIVRPASIDAVFGADSAALWKELSAPET
jgi:putative transcriptional regulator